MNGKMPNERNERQQDFRLLIGAEPFHPKEAGTSTRRRGAAELSGKRETAKEATIVQFAATLTWPDAVRLQGAYGLKLDRYIPNLAYLERLPAETIGRLRSDFLVRVCIPLDPGLKLAPWIADSVQPGAPLELTATLFDDADISTVESALGAIGARDVQIVDDRPIGWRVRARFVLDDPARLAQIADLDDVVWVEPVPVIVNANMEASQVIQSGAVGAGGNPIWDQGLHGEGQVIGVIDDGKIDLKHSFFAGAPTLPGPNHRKVLAMINNVPDAVETSHFTFVAGIVAGDQFGNSGQHAHRGGAWAAKLVCRNRDDKRSLYAQLTETMKAGAFIHNTSWGLPGIYKYDQVAMDADRFSWENEQHVVIAAGANTNPPRDNTPPGIAKNTLCVAAAEAHPKHMERGSGINGPTDDKRRKPDLMAVGCGIRSAKVGTLFDTDLYENIDRQSDRCNTSFATAHTSAAAALVRQYFMEGWYPRGKKQPDAAARARQAQEFGFFPTGALIRAVLLNSTVDMTGHTGYPSHTEGWGLIRLNRALYFDGGPRRLVVKDVQRSAGLESGERRTYALIVKGRAEQLKITLVWTDPPPGEYGSMHPSMNILKLTVEDPEGLGAEYQGNDFDRNGISRPEGDGPQDLVNNVHMVIVNNPPVGRWTITLRADRISLDDKFKPNRQGYALVASGGLAFAGILPP